MPLGIPYLIVWPIDNGIRGVLFLIQMEEVRTKLAELQAKGWTLASIGRAIGQSSEAVESWKADKRSPTNSQLVLAELDRLAKRKHIPKKKIYVKGSRVKGDQVHEK